MFLTRSESQGRGEMLKPEILGRTQGEFGGFGVPSPVGEGSGSWLLVGYNPWPWGNRASSGRASIVSQKRSHGTQPSALLI